MIIHGKAYNYRIQTTIFKIIMNTATRILNKVGTYLQVKHITIIIVIIIYVITVVVIKNLKTQNARIRLIPLNCPYIKQI